MPTSYTPTEPHPKRTPEVETARRSRQEGAIQLPPVLDELPGVVWTTDRDLRFTSVSGAALPLVNVTRDALVGRTLAEHFDNSDPDFEPVAAHRRALATERRVAFELTWHGCDFEASVEPLRDANGRTIGAVGIAIDVSKRRATERELAQSLALLRATLESTADGLLVVDRAGKFTTLNQKFAQMWGIPQSLVDARDDEGAIAAVLKQLKDPEAFVAKVHELYSHPERESFDVLYFKDGRVYERYSKPERVAGECVGRVWSFRDVTERRWAEAERDRLLVAERAARTAAEDAHRRAALCAEASRILASSLDYRATLPRFARVAVAELADGCVVDLFDEKGRLERAAVASTDCAAATVGRALESLPLVGACLEVPAARSWPRVLRPVPAEPPCADSAVPPTILDEDPNRLAFFREHGIGRFLAAPLVARGRVLGVLAFVGIRDDVRPCDLELATELARRAAIAVDTARLYEEAQRAIRLRDEFLTIAAHELRTPCTSLRFVVESLSRRAQAGLEKTPEEVTKRLIATAERQTANLTMLIDRLLDVSQLTGVALRPTLEPVDLAEVTRAVTSDLRGVIERTGSELRVDADAPAVGRWDRGRIEQVISNLLTNAAKYGEGRPIEVGVTSDATTATLRVADHGIGIDPQLKRRIFGRFERAVSPRHYGGLGLGLYIVDRVVSCLGGTIDCDSALGRGATFIVKLPLAGPPPDAAERPRRTPEEPGPTR